MKFQSLRTRLHAKARTTVLRHALLALALLLAVPTQLQAAVTMPTVSTEGHEVWYFVNLLDRNRYLTDNSTDGAAAPATLENVIQNTEQGVNAYLWKVTGNATDGYVLTSRSGHTLYFNSTATSKANTIYTATTPDASAVTTLTFTTAASGILISPSTATGVYMNNYGGSTVNTMGNYNKAADVGSMFTFIPAEGTDFEYIEPSTDTEDYWYTINFVQGGNYVHGVSEGTKAKTKAAIKDSPKQLWKLGGNNIGGYTITNNEGMTLFVDNVQSVDKTNNVGYFYTRANATKWPYKMHFVYTYDSSTGKFKTLLAPLSSTSLFMNQESGIGDGHNCCLYTEDVNSYLHVTACNHARPVPPKHSKDGHEAWYTIEVGDGKFVTDMGEDLKVNALTRDVSNEGQLWKATKDDEGRYTFVSKNGRTLYVKSLVATPTGGTTSEAYAYAATTPTQTYNNFGIRLRLHNGQKNHQQLFLTVENSGGTDSSTDSGTSAKRRGITLKANDGTTTTTYLYLNLLTENDTEVLGLSETETATTTFLTTTAQPTEAALTTNNATVTRYVNQVFDHKTAKTTQVTLDLTPYYNQLLTDLGKTAEELETSGLYLRWHLEDADGNNLVINTGELAAATTTTAIVTDDDDALYWYSPLATTKNLSAAQTDVLKVVYTPADTTALARVVCDFVTATTDGDGNSYFTVTDNALTAVATTTPVAARYVFRMIETREDANNFFIANTSAIAATTNVKSITQRIVKRAAGSSVVDFTAGLTKVYGTTLPIEGFYVRWYLADKDGNMLTDQSPLTYNDNIAKNLYYSNAYFVTTANGICFYPRDNAARYYTTDKYLYPKVTLPDGQTSDWWETVQLVAVISNDLADWKTTSVVGDVYSYYANFGIAADPLSIKGKVVCKFTVSDATEAAPTCSTVHYVNQVFDNTPATTYTTTKDGQTTSTTTPASVTTSVALDLTPYYNQILSDLGATDEELTSNGLYLRWHLENADGNIVPTVPSELAATAASTATALKRDATDNLYWYTALATTQSLNTAKSDVLKVTYTPLDTTDLYNVVCDITYKPTDNGLALSTDGTSVATAPTVAQTKYIIRLIKNKDEAEANYQLNTISSPTTTSIQRTILSINAVPSMTIDCSTELNTLRGAAKNGFFVRWYLADAKGKLIEGAQTNITQATSLTGFKVTDYLNYENVGLLYIPRSQSSSYSSETEFQPIVTLPDGYTWDSLQVIALFSNDLIDWQTQYDIGDRTGVFDYWGIAGDPENITAKVIYSFKIVDPVSSEFKHTSGYAYKYAASGLGANGQQQVHTWSYNYYVRHGESVNLLVPVDDYEDDGNDIEPAAYWRWFDYKTDRASTNLATDSLNGFSLNRGTAGTMWTPLYVTETDGTQTSAGLFKWNMKKGDYNDNARGCFPNRKNVAGVIFNAPSDETWTGDSIACDVSRYKDYDDLTQDGAAAGSFTEPTLSLRYFFNVMPAETCAEKIKAALLKNNSRPVEDYGNVTIGLLNGEGKVKLRLNLSTPDRYYFYNYSSNNFNVPATEDEFDTELTQGNSLTWTVRTSIDGKLYYHVISSYVQGETKQELTLASLRGVYHAVDGQSSDVTLDANTIVEGKAYTIIVYLNSADKTKSTPIARFSCHFVKDSSPTLVTDLSNHRTLNYLNTNYTLAGNITFDDFAGMDLGQPTKPFLRGNAAQSNSWDKPIDWNLSYYGFVYPGLWHLDKDGTGEYKNYYDRETSTWNAEHGTSPFHGDYTLIKSINLDGVSLSQVNYACDDNYNYRYRWYYTATDTIDGVSSHVPVYDCTHARDNSKYGNFLYVDASDEARPIASVEFNAKLCTGSALVASIAVCDVTQGGSTPPQLMFKLYGYRTDVNNNIVEKQLIHTFASAQLKSVIKDQTYTYGKWYQIYARTYISDEVNVENYSKFLVTIDNYGDNTVGSDYGVDDIRIYTRNNRVEVTQENDGSVDCSDSDKKVKLRLRTDNTTLRSLLGMDEEDAPTGKPFYYRIVRASDGAVLGADGQPAATTGDYAGKVAAKLDANGNVTEWVDAADYYHTVWYPQVPKTKTEASGVAPYLESDLEGIEFFTFADSIFTLPTDVTCYVSVSLPEAVSNGENVSYIPSEWGQPSNVCSVYSSEFGNGQQTLVITDQNGTVITAFSTVCGETYAALTMKSKLQIPNAVWGGTLSLSNYPFDWIVCDETMTDEVRTSLVTAIQHLRSLSSTEGDAYSLCGSTNYSFGGKTLPTVAESSSIGSFTYADYTVLNEYLYSSAADALNNPYLNRAFLVHDDSLTVTLNFPTNIRNLDITLLLIPRDSTYTDPETGYQYNICPSALSTSTTIAQQGPQLQLGVKTVEYPTAWGSSAKYVRLGLHQLKAMMEGKGNTLLRIPLIGYSDGSTDGTTKNYLTMENDAAVAVIASNDPTWKNKAASDYNVARVFPRTVTSTTESINLDFQTGQTSTVTGVKFPSVSIDDFHEGYEYELQFSYNALPATNGATVVSCPGFTNVILQIVPAYVTWTNAAENNTNWNNDFNWRRSRKDELYKTKTNNYSDYGTDVSDVTSYPNEEDNSYTTPTAFVPMKFTRVTIPAGVTSPNLNEYKMDDRQGIISDLLNPALNPGTTNIEYYLMVKDNTTTEGSTTYYDVERFYANTCKEIYFKPHAKLRNQHYLDYGKAWVDFETQPNQWTMWTSPLQRVYAGDLYVPSTTGQQTTEAFEDINFVHKNNSGDNSRTTYPVYQRSWKKIMSKVITASGDARGGSDGYYDAYVDYDDVSADDTLMVLTQWSHNYNDAATPYDVAHGFAIRSGRPEVTYADSTLFRLPKADTSYDYYTYEDADGGVDTPTSDAWSIKRDSTGILAISERYLPQKNRNGQMLVTVSDDERATGYYLVGNPYMASMDMAKFFLDAYNPDFYKKYWVLKDGQMVGYGVGEKENAGDLGYVEPMTAFFIKAKSETVEGRPTTVRFAPAMTAANFYGTATTQASMRLRLTATAGADTSEATVIASRYADNDFRDEEDVETLFDSNLDDKPIVYTVSGQMTTQINRMADLTNVPLGFRYTGKEPLRFSVAGVGQLSKPLYLRDAVAGTCTLLADSVSIEVEPNAVGRYFLTSEAAPQRAIQTSLRCYSLEAGKVVAATAEGDHLTEIAVYDTAARLQRSFVPNATSCTFDMPRGIYLITLTSEAVPEGRTFKVLVK